MSKRRGYLKAGASTVLLACSIVALSLDTAYAQACPSGYTVTFSNTITGPNQSAMPWLLAMDPCQTVSVQIVSASASTHPYGNGNLYFQLRNAAGDILAETDFVCGISCSGTLPSTTDVAGYPAPGMRGVEGNPADVLVSTGVFNWFGGPTASYTLTITVAPRPGYNRGGTSFANAPLIDTGVEQDGSVHWREPGEFYRIHLDTGELLFLRGEATANSHFGSYFSITLYDENQQQVKLMVSEAPYGRVTFPAAGTAGTVYQNTGAARDFYLKVTAQFWPIWDFKFTAVTPSLTLSPPNITRGDVATFTVVDAPGGTISAWTYQITDPAALATVSRTVDVNATDWSGQFVVSGTGQVTVGLGGYSAQLSKDAVVNPRNWDPFPPVTPVKRDEGYKRTDPPCPIEIHYTDPSTGGAGIGLYLPCLGYSVDGPDLAFVSLGPNDGVKWLADVTDTTMIDWGMHPDVEDPNSAFSLANCGNFQPGANNACVGHSGGTGFMRASDFHDGIVRHEVGPANSHHAQYVAAMSRPDWNIRLNAEPIVAPPSTNLGAFVLLVKSILGPLQQHIADSIYDGPGGPCSEQCDATCTTYIGTGNVIDPVTHTYAACPVPAPPPFGFRLFSPKGPRK